MGKRYYKLHQIEVLRPICNINRSTSPLVFLLEMTSTYSSHLCQTLVCIWNANTSFRAEANVLFLSYHAGDAILIWKGKKRCSKLGLDSQWYWSYRSLFFRCFLLRWRSRKEVEDKTVVKYRLLLNCDKAHHFNY